MLQLKILPLILSYSYSYIIIYTRLFHSVTPKCEFIEQFRSKKKKRFYIYFYHHSKISAQKMF